MKIHYCAIFDVHPPSYHGDFDITATPQQIFENRDKITSVAIAHLKQKCEYFGKKFEDLIFFEVYYYNEKKEVLIFKKQKQ